MNLIIFTIYFLNNKNFQINFINLNKMVVNLTKYFSHYYLKFMIQAIIKLFLILLLLIFIQ